MEEINNIHNQEKSSQIYISNKSHNNSNTIKSSQILSHQQDYTKSHQPYIKNKSQPQNNILSMQKISFHNFQQSAKEMLKTDKKIPKQSEIDDNQQENYSFLNLETESNQDTNVY
ncbi:hypothetical protein PPERSA_08858 [Pseudocohnilembus persalinus]|uniref:Uncharacterized protein n=1 Tax=Pseudocohnilembus persalinus TaxID=266149 RepID=A0A0V0R3S7_PSEPJ|nr:hypothetical protein PPERSA_08858 [Pseudocohnilembus persalinus]|eukprot:KRX09142.1 hypothetical protein PPERSA_08858 [Pseudocohnilembus persalinus]